MSVVNNYVRIGSPPNMVIVAFNDRTDDLDALSREVSQIVRDRREHKLVAIWRKHGKFPYPTIGESGRYMPPIPPGLIRP